MKSAAIFCCVLFAISIADEDVEKAKKSLLLGNARFTSLFMESAVKSEPNSNVVMSAYSVLTPLAQLSLAAEGESQKELLGAMGLPNTDVVKKAFKSEDLRSTAGVTIKTASRIYISMESKLKKEFNAISKDIFGTEVKKVNFADGPSTAKEVNTWVESQTNNLINNILSPDAVDSSARAILVNAIYFKGKWATAFDANSTQNKEFFVTKDQKIKLPMMFKTDTLSYSSNDELNAQLVEIPYDKNHASLLVILPNDLDGISALEDKIKDSVLLTKATDQMYDNEVNLHLPKFRIDSTLNLVNVLQSIGVGKIFSPRDAQLTNLVEGDSLYVSAAVQKAYIEVNEEGTEAAAVNSFDDFMPMPLPPSTPVEVNANHPFVFAIKVQGKIIFSGVLRK